MPAEGAGLRFGPPLVCDEPAATDGRAFDGHGTLAVSAATNRLGLGDKIRLIRGHRDPKVNPHPSPASGGREGWGLCMPAWPPSASSSFVLSPRELQFTDQEAESAT